jgi:diguanylate cyclase
MLYDLDTRDDAKRFSDTAIQLIESYDLNATPDYFRLFYDYASERDPMVARTLNDVSDETPERFRSEAERLLSTHYGEEYSLRLLNQTGDALQAQIRDVLGHVSSAGADVGHFGNALDGLEAGLDDISDGKAMRALVGQMLVAARQMKIRSERLEQDLQQSASEIRNLQEKLDETRREALVDKLTGVTNRAGFDRSLKREIETARQEDHPVTLVMCDIDHFKTFNDTYGHQLGDQVLKLVGGVLRADLKGRDSPCRYGGEEFALILPETALDGGVFVADNIRRAIASKRIIRKSTGEEIARVTMSFGVATLHPEDSPAMLISRADAALYQSKMDGRNRVTAESDMAVEAAE